MTSLHNIAITATDIYQHRILIIDFGSQYTQLIARRIREIGVYCEIHPHTISNDAILSFNASGIILSGGPDSVTTEHAARAPELIFSLKIPILGICYGMQTMAQQLGGAVMAGKKREFGYAQITFSQTSPLFASIQASLNERGSATLDVWMSHGDQVSALPQTFSVIASTENCAIAAMGDDQRQFYGLQFHPEVLHTHQGNRILETFLFTICGCKANWLPNHIIEQQIKNIRTQVGNEQVILGLSGGVDSSVAAALLHAAIGDQLTCIFVDTGLLRLDEAKQVQSIFAEHLGLKLICVEASELFYQKLKGVLDPEAKRKIIGKQFIEVFEAEAKKLPNVKWLAQGTIYSDVIESAGVLNSKAHVIKSHHNVGGLPQKMKLQLIEPLRELFKDEVRQIGLALGLAPALIHRHPFPGPGLGVRVLGEVKTAYVHKLRLADAILLEELQIANLYHAVSQAFAVFLPIKSVGVLGDARHYDHVIALRVVETTDFMTAKWSHLPYAFLEKVSNRIINEVPGISRVTYDISSKPPATIEWE